MNITYPNISGKTPQEQLVQIRSYLFGLVDQLNLDRDQPVSSSGALTLPVSAAPAETARGPQSTFNQIKSLIIKSAEIVDAYYEKMATRLDGLYVAQSDFGTYRQELSAVLEQTAQGLTQSYENIQQLSGLLEQVIEVNANIRTGLLFHAGEPGEVLPQELPDGTPIYGVEVGQTTQVDGEKIFDKFARFTAYGMFFYDENENISAYITDNRLRIPNAVVETTLTRGGFVETVFPDGSSVERWAGV